MVEKFKIPIALSLVGVTLIIGGLVLNRKEPQEEDFPKESLIQSAKTISVDVSGAVVKPGVYQLKTGDRIEEAVNAAGGFAETANGEYISKILNLAQILVDGSKIYIPSTGEEVSVSQAGVVAGVDTQTREVVTKVNINLATQSEIESLSGIGPVTASKIISGRPYQKIEELVDKKIVGKAVYEKIKDFIVLY